MRDGKQALALRPTWLAMTSTRRCRSSILSFASLGAAGPKSSTESRAYHAWIITPTPFGCHLWTEETMQGPLWIEMAKAPDIFWLTHEKLLKDLAKVAIECEAQERSKTQG